MSCTNLADYIKVFPETMAAAHCQALIERFEAASAQESCRADGRYSFSQLDVSAEWPDQHKLLVPIFLSHFNQYQATIQARFWPLRFSFEHLRLKRYLPDGRDQFPLHVDVMDQAAARRFMTAIIYLNEPEGGETVFPGIDISVTPERGKLIVFPPLWLFPHAGLPPRSSAKYILHTYLCYPS